MSIQPGEFKEILTIEKIRAFNQKYHFLGQNNKAKRIEDISDSLLGLHSARLPTPFVMIHSRISNVRTSDLYNILFVDRNMIKLRCMRTTLHSVSHELAPIVHKATLSLRLRDILRFYKSHNINENNIQLLKKKIIYQVRKAPMSAPQISDFLNNEPKLKKLIVHKNFPKVLIKDLWENGDLCYINENPNWQKENRLYGHTKTLYPKLRLNDINQEEACKELVFRHIDQYGPVSLKDISWWSGISVKSIKEALNLLKNKIREVRIDDCPNPCYMSNEKFEAYNQFSYDAQTESVYLLAYEDSSFKGYFETRYRYIDMRFYDQLYNQIGEVKASIVLNGKAIGVWNWNNKKTQITYKLFDQRKHNRLVSKIENEINKMVNYLYGEKNQTILNFE